MSIQRRHLSADVICEDRPSLSGPPTDRQRVRSRQAHHPQAIRARRKSAADLTEGVHRIDEGVRHAIAEDAPVQRAAQREPPQHTPRSSLKILDGEQRTPPPFHRQGGRKGEGREPGHILCRQLIDDQSIQVTETTRPSLPIPLGCDLSAR